MSRVRISVSYTHLVIGQPDAWLFPGKDDSVHISLKTVDNRFRRILDEISISRPDKKYERGACFHCLRHTFVQRSFVQLKEMGISVDNSVPYLSIYLGHSNLRQTERYMKFTTDMFLDEFQKFAAFSGDCLLYTSRFIHPRILLSITGEGSSPI